MAVSVLWLLGVCLMPMSCSVSAQHHHKKLLAEATVYCNITSDCEPCAPKYLDSDACKPTAYAEHLTCSPSSTVQHQITLVIHRRLTRRTTLLHVSRSCKPAHMYSGSDVIYVQHGSSSRISEQAAGKYAGPSITIVDGSSSNSEGLTDTPMAVHLYPLSTRGGLNLLYFELAMLLLLGGALPAVYMRKRH